MSNKDQYCTTTEQKKREIPVFMQPWWLDAVCESWDAVVVRKGDMTTGLWAYPVEKRFGIRMMRTPMLTPYLGPLSLSPSDMKENRTDGFEHETVTELLKQLPEAPVWNLAIRPGMKQAGLFKNNRLDVHVRQTFLIDLVWPEATLLANMKDTTRRNIRAAAELNITNEPERLSELYQFQQNTLAKKGKGQPYTLTYLQRILDACLANNAAAVWVGRSGGEIQAIVWQVWDDKCSYYFMGGQNPEGNSYRAMTLLLWHSIKHAKGRNQEVFDLEGSMDEGVERFFRSFGGRRELYLVLLRNKSVLWSLKQLFMP